MLSSEIIISNPKSCILDTIRTSSRPSEMDKDYLWDIRFYGSIIAKSINIIDQMMLRMNALILLDNFNPRIYLSTVFKKTENKTYEYFFGDKNLMLLKKNEWFNLLFKILEENNKLFIQYLINILPRCYGLSDNGQCKSKIFFNPDSSYDAYCKACLDEYGLKSSSVLKDD